MKQATERYIRATKDFWRLTSTGDLLDRAGMFLIKKSPRATFWTAGITSSGYLSGALGLPGFTGLEAITLPFVVGGLLLSVGVVLCYVPRTISGKFTTIAEANDLNLMEDYRKSQTLVHLNALWDRVFWYESQIRYRPQERRDERSQIAADREQIAEQIRRWDAALQERQGVESDADVDRLVTAIMAEKPLTKRMEKSREGFVISCLYAIRHFLPQSSQTAVMGFDLSLYEDMCDGAFFDRSDTKLFEQYLGNRTLTDIQIEARLGRFEVVRQIGRRICGRIWFGLVIRKIAIGVGRAVKELNTTYDTDLFNAQSILWPGQENARSSQTPAAARAHVLRLRRSLVTSVFGDTYDKAVGILDRMLLPCFEFATDLRVAYDPEYCEGSLDYVAEDTDAMVSNNVASDLRGYGYGGRALAGRRARAQRAKADLVAFDRWMQDNAPDALRDDPLARRAARIMFHVDRYGLRTAARRGDLRQQGDRLKELFADAIAHKQMYGNRLVTLRLHHQLTILQIEGYRRLVKKLAYSG